MSFERSWIQHLQSRWPQVDLRHDTAFDADTRQVLTTDMLVEGVHFTWDYFAPEDLGWRSIAVNLSDLAATGAIPRDVLVSVGMPTGTPMDTLARIFDGIDACCRQFGCRVVGGDTVRAAQTILSVSVTGTLPHEHQPGRRHTAEPGHVLAVTGHHGLAQAGLVALQRKLSGFEAAKQAHLRPMPRMRTGQRLAQVLPKFAAMDSSDGLADAVMQLAEASHVDIVLRENRLALHPELIEVAALAKADPLDWLLYGGEDFQLVVSLPPETLSLFPELVPIGVVRDPERRGTGQGWLDTPGGMQALDADRTFQHFQPARPRTSQADPPALSE